MSISFPFPISFSRFPTSIPYNYSMKTTLTSFADTKKNRKNQISSPTPLTSTLPTKYTFLTHRSEACRINMDDSSAVCFPGTNYLRVPQSYPNTLTYKAKKHRLCRRVILNNQSITCDNATKRYVNIVCINFKMFSLNMSRRCCYPLQAFVRIPILTSRRDLQKILDFKNLDMIDCWPSSLASFCDKMSPRTHKWFRD
jgi:hypothetical protein